MAELPFISGRWARATAVAIVALTCMFAATGPPVEEARAGGRYTRSASRVAEGLKLIKLYDNRLRARIKVLVVDPKTPMTLDVALANDVLPGRETTGSMAARHDAIAAVNASFGTSWGRPIGIFAEDGFLMASPLVTGGAFSMTRDENEGNIGYPSFSVFGRVAKNKEGLRIGDWNDLYPNRERINVWTEAGGEVVKPPKDSCSVRLIRAGRMRWSSVRKGIVRSYRVRKSACRETALGLGKGIVLAARRGTEPASRLMNTTARGDRVNLTWSVGWPGSMDVVGGSPVLMLDKKIIVQECDAYVCRAHPRTGVGVTPNGKVLLVTVDGRQSDSKGMTVLQFAKLFKYLGAQKALNLDGGGSSTMVVKGELTNQPSEGHQREVASAILVLDHPDGKEPVPAPATNSGN